MLSLLCLIQAINAADEQHRAPPCALVVGVLVLTFSVRDGRAQQHRRVG